MANFKIITNNPMVWDEYREFTEYIDTAEDVFVICRNAIHQGAVLINHPLSGSIPPHLCPYKSLVISKEANATTDFLSLRLIEEAMAALNKPDERNGAAQEDIRSNLQVLKDFQLIDLDLLNSALAALPSEYHT